MKTLLREMLDSALFGQESGRKMLFVSERPSDSATQSTIIAALRELTTAAAEFYELPNDESFLPSIIEKIPTNELVHTFIVPPVIDRRFLSDRMRAQFPAMGFGEIVLASVLNLVASRSVVWACVPESVCYNTASFSTRERIASISKLRLVVSNDMFARALNAVTDTFPRMASIMVEKGGSQDNLVRFFKCPATESANEISEAVADFRRLVKQAGGSTRLGYVLREELPSASWYYEAYHPQITKRKADLTNLGEVQCLADLVEVVRSLHPGSERAGVTATNGVVVLEGRAIREDGTLELDESRHHADVSAERILRPGDICIRTIRCSGQQLMCAVVDNDLPPAIPGHSVLAIRFRDSSLIPHAAFLASYLKSTACMIFLESQGVGIQINPNKLLTLPVPIADEPLRVATESLGHAAARFRAWADELETARGALFDSQSARNARTNAMSMEELQNSVTRLQS